MTVASLCVFTDRMSLSHTSLDHIKSDKYATMHVQPKVTVHVHAGIAHVVCYVQ